MNKDIEYWWEDVEIYHEYKKLKKSLLFSMRKKFATKYNKPSGSMESVGTLMKREPR